MATERVDNDAFEADSYDEETSRISFHGTTGESQVLSYISASAVNVRKETSELMNFQNAAGSSFIIQMKTFSKSSVLNKAMHETSIEYDYGQYDN